MTRKFAIGAALALLTVANAAADIVVKLPKNAQGKTANMTAYVIDEYARGRNAIETVENKSMDFTDGKASLPTPGFNAVVMIDIDGIEANSQTVYTAPGDDIIIDVQELSPFKANVSGSALMDDINKVEGLLQPIMDEYTYLRKNDLLTNERMDNIISSYDATLVSFIKDNPDVAGAAYALINLNDPELIIELSSLLGSNARASILAPITDTSIKQAQQELEQQKKLERLQSGSVTAPDFTLPDLKGKNVSLSSLRGKWVIIDFWGAWCVWCIKGMPELKNAYEKYAGKLEIIGVDCGDTIETWKSAVDKYKLPWIHVFNGDSNRILEEYGVSGFPTKVIVNPEGKIVNITAGEDPSFYDTLEQYIK